jgi:outer membrane receptor protein involved in Fe transport
LRRIGKEWGRLACGALCAVLLGNGAAGTAALPIKIPAEPISQALVDFALQTQLSIGDTSVDFGDAKSNPVYGTYSPQDALSKLLAQTGFGFEFLDRTTVRIRALGLPALNSRRDGSGIEIVVVTATKRQEVARQLPYSFAAITARQIGDLHAETIDDLTTQVAQLTATNMGAGQDKLFLRGLTDSVVPGLSESMVGVYLDESRIADDAPDPDLRLVDIDRVEVLNGPQGTLYGGGSLGGLVRIVTRKPVLDEHQAMFATSVAATKHGALSAGFDAMLNVPLVPDVLALRVVGYVRHDGGFIEETRLNIPNSNRMGTQGGRAALTWQANAKWSVTAGLAYQHIKADDSQYYDEGSPPLQRDSYLLEPHSDLFLDASLTIDADLGGVSLVSSSAVVDRRLDERFDATLAWPKLTGFPLGPSPFDDGRRILSYTHETRLLSSSEGPWKWLAGIFLSHRDEDFHSRLSGPDASGDTIVARSEMREDRANEAAIFGEVSYAFSDAFSLTGGIRAFNAAREVAATVDTILQAGGSSNFKGSNNQSGATPKAVLSYRPSPALMFYAQVSEGYRLGGLNVDGPAGSAGSDDDNAFDSDTLWNYEIGSKTRFFNGAVLFNAAAYFDRWKNVQTDQIGPDGSFFILNAGTVDNVGFETDVTLHPIDNLTLSGNFFWNSPKFTNVNPLLVKSEGVLPGAPRTKFGITGRYDFPLGALDAFAAADYGYVGRSHLGFDETNSPIMGGYHIANFRIGLSNSNWEAVLFVSNLEREDENTFGFGNPFDPNLQVTPPRPRTIGLSLTWHD